MYQPLMGNQPFSKPAIVAAMQFVAERDALIIDLRANRGGHTSVVPFMLAYLFDAPTLLGITRFRDGGRVVAQILATFTLLERGSRRSSRTSRTSMRRVGRLNPPVSRQT